MRILALDYGLAHTGVAISDPSGTIVRPMDDIDDAASSDGIKRIATLIDAESVASVVVGLPVSLSGERGKQAQETEEFVVRLRREIEVPVYEWDERFTSKIAAEKGRGSGASSHSLAACCLLEDYLGSAAYRGRISK